MSKKWEYATLEWLWDVHTLRQNFPSKPEKLHNGSYQEVVDTLTELGHQGWEVVSSASQANWIFWTLKREI